MLDKNLGVQYIDSHFRNYENISPEEVANYYQSLGDWQNLLTKTDYSYSPASDYYRKKINGIYPVIPNMSRPNLWQYKFGENSADTTDRSIRLMIKRKSLQFNDLKSEKWTFGGKRVFFAPSSTFTHVVLLSLFIFVVFFSLKKISFSYF